MSRSDTAIRPDDVPFRAAGSGHYSARYCMGCHKHVSNTAGSKGSAGIKWRCGTCVLRAAK